MYSYHGLNNVTFNGNGSGDSNNNNNNNKTVFGALETNVESVDCFGAFSCSNNVIITSEVECYGSYSCLNSLFTNETHDIYCYAFGSCENIILNFVNSVSLVAAGVESINNMIIRVNTDNNDYVYINMIPTASLLNGFIQIDIVSTLLNTNINETQSAEQVQQQ